MKIKKIKIISLFVLSVFYLGLTACSNDKKETTTTKTTSEETKKFDNSNGFSKDSVVMYIDDEKIRYQDISTYLYIVDKRYSFFGNKLWNQVLSDDETIGEKARQNICNYIISLKIINKNAEKNGVVLTEDEKDEVLNKSEELMQSASESDVKKYILSEKNFEAALTENAICKKAFQMLTPDIDTNELQKEARQAEVGCYTLLKHGTDKYGNEKNLSADEEESAYSEAEQFRNDVSSQKDFISYARKKSDLSIITTYIGKGNSTYGEDVISAALALKKGEISEVVEDDNGFYVLYCINPEDEIETFRSLERQANAKKRDMFATVYSDWSDNIDVTLNDDFWQKYSFESNVG